MPITRRRRAQPPEEPDSQQNGTAEAAEPAQPAEASQPAVADNTLAAPDEPPAAADAPSTLFAVPEQPPQPAPESLAQEAAPVEPPIGAQFIAPSAAATPPIPPSTAPTAPPGSPVPASPSVSTPAASAASAYMPLVSAPEVSNGTDSQRFAPLEGGRRTARGEFFRRPPHLPPAQPYAQPPVAAPPPPPPLQAPTHEITLPLGNLLHLAYNPGYTGADEARSKLLSQLAHESKTGGRARCWNCGSLAIVYDRWNTRSKTFGEVGIAYCEICGAWSVL